MALHFDRAEFESRIVAARKALAAERLDALLLFAQESLYYLTGFDTSGFVFFQCAVLTPGRRADHAADAPARSRAGAPHLDHRGHPALVRHGRQRPEPASLSRSWPRRG